MAKDPAFLFYPNDFLEGTYTLEDEQIGMYIKLLCLQHQRYKLTEKDMLKICKTYDKDIFNKFTIDENGFYYNARLREESEKRKAYSESRRLNRMSKKEDKKDISKTYDKDMVNVNEDINELWIKSFKRNPSIVEYEETEKLINKFSLKIIEKAFMEAGLRNIKSLATVIKYLDDKGNLLSYDEYNSIKEKPIKEI